VTAPDRALFNNPARLDALRKARSA